MGTNVARGAQAAVVESVKAASEVFAPVSGTVVGINGGLETEPGAVNEDAAGKGWFFKLKIADPAELSGLLDQSAYEAYLQTLE